METMMQGLPESWTLDGQVAIVTGAERGIGRVTAELLHARGARVVESDLSDGVHELAGEGYATMTGHFADEDVARRTVALAIERFGRLDIPVINAGRTLNKPLRETSFADWDAVMTTNARGNFVHALAATQGVSLNVIREALNRLAGEGLIDVEPQLGFSVRGLSVEDLQDLVEQRSSSRAWHCAAASSGAVSTGSHRCWPRITVCIRRHSRSPVV